MDHEKNKNPDAANVEAFESGLADKQEHNTTEKPLQYGEAIIPGVRAATLHENTDLRDVFNLIRVHGIAPEQLHVHWDRSDEDLLYVDIEMAEHILELILLNYQPRPRIPIKWLYEKLYEIDNHGIGVLSTCSDVADWLSERHIPPEFKNVHTRRDIANKMDDEIVTQGDKIWDILFELNDPRNWQGNFNNVMFAIAGIRKIRGRK